MEPFPKRQRIYAQIERKFPQSFGSEEAYFNSAAQHDFITDEGDLVGEEGRGDEEEEEEEEEEGEEEEEEPNYDDDSLFQERRARLDNKLKSTFEAIFEKYGKDFDGIGDEIDLVTGEIVVNNGHLLQMQDEMDPGDANQPRSFQAELSDDQDDEQIMSQDETELDGDEVEDSEEVETTSDDNDDDMVEDDLILRGFARAKRLLQASPRIGTVRAATVRDQYHNPILGSSSKPTTLPSESKVLSQFGPLIGPQILEYISQQSKPDDRHIEPAWRVPNIPLSRPTNRSMDKKILLPSEMERSPSPEAAGSIWAPVKTRMRGKSSGKGLEKPFRGGTFGTKDHKIGSSGVSRPRAPNFTKEDDDLLEKFVIQGRQEGRTLTEIFRDLEARHSFRSWNSWRDRYFRKVAYFTKTGTAAESDLASETSVYTDFKTSKTQHGMESFEYVPVQAAELERPTRIRKPAQKDSHIISWQDAVNALDPDEHAGILEDARILNLTPKHSNSRVQDTRLVHQDGQTEDSRRKKPELNIPAPKIQQRISQSKPARPSPGFEEEPKIPAVPCPHADCRMNSKVKYKLQPRIDEDVSEMNLHLFTKHHTTPFPCSEYDCPRSGENGYFTQADLAKHAWYAHPGVGALQRLRGRVAPEFLDPNNLRTMARNKLSDEIENQRTDQPMKSDFMSPSKGFTPRVMSSTEFTASNFDLDRTLTPRIGSQHYVTSSTPMTGISSLKVNHSPNITTPAREINDSQDWPMSDYHADDDSVEVFVDLSEPEINASADLHATTETSARRPSSLENRPASSEKELNLLPTPATSTVHPQEMRRSLADSQRISRSLESDTVNVMKHKKPISSPEVFLGQTLHHSAGKGLNKSPIALTSRGQLDSDVISSEESQAMESAPHEISEEDNFQNTGIHTKLKGLESPQQSDAISPKQSQPKSYQNPSHALMLAQQETETPRSRENIALISTAPLQNPIEVVIRSELEPIPVDPTVLQSSLRPKSTIQTPANPKPRKSLLRKLIRSGDVDELSLCEDDIILISSRSKVNHQLDEKTRIKREDSAIRTPISSIPKSKKRKLEAFQDDGEIDELGLDEDISPVIRATTVKREREDLTLSSIPTKTRKEALKQGKIPGSVILQHIESTATTGTPLLDLTPNRRDQKRTNKPREIADSAEVSSPLIPSDQRREVALRSSSPLDGLLTPLRKKGWDFNLKANKTVISIRTPGGTMRRCGEGGFECRKPFCFRCESSSLASTIN